MGAMTLRTAAFLRTLKRHTTRYQRMPRISATASLTTLLDESIRPIYVVDAGRRVIYCNPALAAWLDLEPGRILGRTVEYHSETSGKTAARRDDAPLADLCP